MAISGPMSLGASAEQGWNIPKASTQLIVGLAETASSNRVTLMRYERKNASSKWKLVGEVFPGRLGGRGLAWGRGINPTEAIPSGLKAKREGDLRSPVGVFTLGKVFAYSPDVERHPLTDFVDVGPSDLLVEDPTSPMYNTHVRLPGLPSTDWEKSQVMEQVDPAHELQVFINHNVKPAPISGAGSAILFHVWRKDGAATTAGCTSMDRSRVTELVRWINPERMPLYVLLPVGVYRDVMTSWGLPSSAAGATESPATESPATESPVTTKPVTIKPVTIKPVTIKPVTTKPVTSKPSVTIQPSPTSAARIAVEKPPVIEAPEPPVTRRVVKTVPSKSTAPPTKRQ